MLEQVIEQKKKIETNLASIGHLVAVGSGKGGVGKSTLTMLLALAFTARGHKCAILDADFNGPSQARLGGLKTLTPVPGSHGLVVPMTKSGLGVVSFGSLVPEPEPVDFPTVSQSDSYTWRATKEFSILGDILAGSDWRPFDTLLLDLPPGSERTFHYAEFFGAMAKFVLVTLPSDLSRGVVARSISALQKSQSALLGYIENMNGYYCASCREVRPLFPSSAEVNLGAACLGEVPFDPALADLCDRGISPAARDGLVVFEAVDMVCGRILERLQAGGRSLK